MEMGQASIKKKNFRVPTSSYPVYTLFIQCTNHWNAFFLKKKVHELGSKTKEKSITSKQFMVV
jgi:hypothetical protein